MTRPTAVPPPLAPVAPPEPPEDGAPEPPVDPTPTAPRPKAVPPPASTHATPAPKAGTPPRKVVPVSAANSRMAVEATRAPEKSGIDLRRTIIGVVSLALIGVAAFLFLAPRPKVRDELAEMQSETTLPQEPKSVPLTASRLTPMNPARPSAAIAGGSAATGTANPVLGPTGIANADPGAGQTQAAPPPVAPPPATSPPAVAANRAPSSGFRLQAASLIDSATANSVGRQMQRQTGYNYEVLPALRDSVTWFAVYLGPFDSRESALAARERMIQMNPREFSGVIVRPPR
jgi:cell division septation protein DedD